MFSSFSEPDYVRIRKEGEKHCFSVCLLLRERVVQLSAELHCFLELGTEAAPLIGDTREADIRADHGANH